MYKWLREWFDESLEIATGPKKFFSEKEELKDYGYTIKFAVTSYIIAFFLRYVFSNMILLMAKGTTQITIASIPQDILKTLILGSITGIISLFLWSFILHLLVILFGSENFKKTVNAVAYPIVITALFGWIPLVNSLALIYVLVAEARGIEKLHEFSFGKSLAVVFIPSIILFILALMLLVSLFFI